LVLRTAKRHQRSLISISQTNVSIDTFLSPVRQELTIVRVCYLERVLSLRNDIYLF